MYIVIELQTNPNGTVGNIVSSYPTKDEAFSKFHNILMYAAVSSLPCHAAVILDNHGQQIAAQYFEHEVTPNE